MVDTRSYPGLVARIDRSARVRVARQTRIYCAPSGIRVREKSPKFQALVQPAFGQIFPRMCVPLLFTALSACIRQNISYRLRISSFSILI